MYIFSYTSDPEITGARSKFFNGHCKYLLMTERFQYFKRLFIRGIHHFIFYGLPIEASIFRWCLEMLSDSPEVKGTIICLFDRFETNQLKRILGENKAKQLLLSEKSLFVISI